MTENKTQIKVDNSILAELRNAIREKYGTCSKCAAKLAVSKSVLYKFMIGRSKNTGIISALKKADVLNDTRRVRLEQFWEQQRIAHKDYMDEKRDLKAISLDGKLMLLSDDQLTRLALCVKAELERRATINREMQEL